MSEPSTKPRRITLDFYTDAAGEHRWRLLAANGKVVGASSEGFRDPREARFNADLVAWQVGRMLHGEDAGDLENVLSWACDALERVHTGMLCAERPGGPILPIPEIQDVRDLLARDLEAVRNAKEGSA